MVRGIGRVGFAIAALGALSAGGALEVVEAKDDARIPEPREPKRKPPARFDADELREWRKKQPREAARRLRRMEKRRAEAEARS